MSEELEFMRRSFSDLQREMRSTREEIKKDLDIVESKLDRYLEETVVQRTEIKELKNKTGEHNKLLVQGNGQKPLTVKVAEQSVQLKELSSGVAACKEHREKEEDPAEIKKEKIKRWTWVGTVVSLVISAIAQWLGVPKIF